MGRLTSGWTDRHRQVALAQAAAVIAMSGAVIEGRPVAFWVAGAVVVAVLVSLPFDSFAGIVVGLACAAGLIAVKRATGRWEDDVFEASLIETLGIVLAASASGRAGAGLRDPLVREDPSTRADGAPAPVFGMLGLLSYDLALTRLEDEVARAREHRRPLTVLILDIHVEGGVVDASEHGAVLRAVARILDTRLRDRDVPFAITPERLGAILPETTRGAAWERVGAIVDALGAATFMSRLDEERRPLRDAARIQAGIAEFVASESAEGLLDLASAGITPRRASSETQA